MKRRIKSRNYSRHGMSSTREYGVWKEMRRRCNNPKRVDFINYGGRGIKICERWDEFENFYSDMGDIPPGKTIDRIDNDGDYNKKNCRWASRQIQSLNRRPKAGSSKHRGVCWDKKSGKWRSQIRDKGINYNLGLFICELAASKAYQKAHKKVLESIRSEI